MNQRNSPRFVPIKNLSLALVIVFWVNVVADIILAFGFIIIGILHANDANTSSKTYENTDSTMPVLVAFLLLMLIVIFFIACILWISTCLSLIILVPVWFYTAYNNLIPLRAYKKTYSSTWAAIGWFVPVFYLFRPIQIARELWVESDPDFEPKMSFISKTAYAPFFVTGWWLAFIAAVFFVNFLPISSNTEQNVISSFLLSISSLTLGLSAKYAIPLIKGVAERQRQRFEKLSAMNLNL